MSWQSDVRKAAKLADEQGKTVPFSLRELIEANVPNGRITRVFRGESQ